jgi:tRNA A22 N-methylase
LEKTSRLDCDSTVKSLLEQEMGFLLLEDDEKSVYEILASKSSFADRQGMCGNGQHVTYHLFPLMYKNYKSATKDLIQSRANAVQNIFERWSQAGLNKHHAKNPFASKHFNKFLDDIELTKADYMLLLVA